MVSFKEQKGKNVFALTIVLIVVFFVFIYGAFKFNKSKNDTFLGLMMIPGFITLVLSITLTITNNIYRNNKELSDSDTMDKALSGIPPTILICLFIIAGISIGSKKEPIRPQVIEEGNPLHKFGQFKQLKD